MIIRKKSGMARIKNFSTIVILLPLLDCGIPLSKSRTLVVTDGTQTRGCGLSSLKGLSRVTVDKAVLLREKKE